MWGMNVHILSKKCQPCDQKDFTHTSQTTSQVNGNYITKKYGYHIAKIDNIAFFCVSMIFFHICVKT